MISITIIWVVKEKVDCSFNTIILTTKDLHNVKRKHNVMFLHSVTYY